MSRIIFYSKESHSTEILKLLREKLQGHQIFQWPDLDCSPEELDYAICWHPPQAFFRGATNLKAIFSLAAGVDHLLKHTELPNQVPIVRLSDAGMADKIAEYVHYGVLRTHRGFHHYQRLQKTGQWQPQPDIHAADYRVGILGYGVIGRCVAHRLHAAGYQVSAFKRSANTTEESFPVLTGNSDHFLSQLNVLVCILPLTAETSGMINTELLAQLPAGAHFINVGRGDQVVEDDLLLSLIHI